MEVAEDVWGLLIPTNSRVTVVPPTRSSDQETDPDRETFAEAATTQTKMEPTEEEIKDANCFKACVFLAGVDRGRYKKVVDELNNEYVAGNIKYPEDVPEMFKMLSNRRGVSNSKYDKNQQKIDAIQDGVKDTSFLQKSPGNKQMKRIYCYKCGEKGHMAKDCPRNSENGSDDESSQGTKSSKTSSKSGKGRRKSLAQSDLGWSS